MPFDYRANSGGPRSRTRTEHLHASLLVRDRGRFGCPLRVTAALDFGSADPLAAVEARLRAAGIEDPEALRARYQVVAEPCICSATVDMFAPRVADGPLDEVLRRVLILGLSTAHVYDPARPVLLTRTSLTRHLTLYGGEGFYA